MSTLITTTAGGDSIRVTADIQEVRERLTADLKSGEPFTQFETSRGRRVLFVPGAVAHLVEHSDVKPRMVAAG